MRTVLLRLIPLTSFFLVWHLLSMFTRPIILPSPISAALGIARMMLTEELLQAITVTLIVLATGFTAAAVVGIVVGIVLGWFEKAHVAFSPYIYAFGSSPHFIFIPLIIIWFGIGVEARLFYVFSTSSIPIIINVMHGVRYIESEMVEVAKAYGANLMQTFRHIVLGGMSTHLIAGLRLGLVRAFTATILSEMFFRLEGIGGLLLKYASLFKTSEVFGLIIVVVILSQLSLRFIKFLETTLLKWKK